MKDYGISNMKYVVEINYGFGNIERVVFRSYEKAKKYGRTLDGAYRLYREWTEKVTKTSELAK